MPIIEVKEQYLDGSTRLHVGVKFRALEPVKLVGKNAVARELQTYLGKRPDGTSRVGSRTMDLVAAKDEIFVVCEEVANVLQSYRCTDCDKPWRFGQPGQARHAQSVCIDSSHTKALTGGLAGTTLALLDDEDRVVPVSVAPNIEPEPPPTYEPADLHARVMRRLGVLK